MVEELDLSPMSWSEGQEQYVASVKLPPDVLEQLTRDPGSAHVQILFGDTEKMNVRVPISDE